jgi:tetratricopeptide (TPR) repeat protein
LGFVKTIFTMRFSFVLFGLLLYAGTLLPQQSEKLVDSLEQVLFFTEDIGEKISLNLSLAKAYLKDDPGKSMEFSDMANKLASSINADNQRAIAYFYRGRALSKLYRRNESINSLVLAKDIFKGLDQKKWVADVCYELGDVYKNKLDFKKSLYKFLEGLSIVKDMGNKEKVASFYNGIGGVYYDQNDFDGAFDYFKKSMLIWEKLGNKRGMAIQYNNLGEIYRFKGEFDRALSYYRKASSYNNEESNNLFLGINYDNIGNVFLSMGQYDSAEFYLEKSLDVAWLSNDDHLISMVNNSLGSLMLENKNYGLANVHFQKAYKLADKNQLNDHKKDAAYGLSLVFAEKKDFKKALHYYKEYKTLNDSIINADNSGRITEIELNLQFENEQKLKEIERQRTYYIYILIALGLFGLIIILIMLYGRLMINVRHSKSKAINLYLENKHLEEDIDFKNRELATNVMYLLRKNELINYISDKLLKVKGRFKSKNQPIIQEILMDLQSNINSEIWLEFEKRFRAVHKGFYDKLNWEFPKLTDSDKKLCALLRLNLSTKEIASIMHQNPNSVEVARTRLRKKLDLSNKDIGLVSFLSSL